MNPPNDPADSSKNASSWWRTVQAVLWAFLGVRRRADFQKDVERLRPLQLLAVGVTLAFLFVAGLMVLVSWIVRV